jgi:hypothetical protein
MLEAVIMFGIWILVIGLCFAIVIWVLQIVGIPVPMHIIKIVGAIVFLIVLLYFVQAVMSGHMPRIGRL